MFNWKSYFPNFEPREQQKEIINFALDAFINKNKRFVIIEAETGSGKSFCAYTIGKYLYLKENCGEKYKKGVWILTSQKILQDQYTKDLGPPKGEICSIKSSSNYQCQYFKDNKCSESQHLLTQADKDSKFYKSCSYKCIYKMSKKSYLQSSIGITNFPYFLTESSFIGKIEPRQLLIIDEAHSIEDELSKFIEVVISEKFSNLFLNINMPNKLDLKDNAFIWIKDFYFPALKSKIEEDKIELLKFKDSNLDETDEAKRLINNIDKLSKHLSKIEKFLLLYHKDNWVFNTIVQLGNSNRKLEFKPIDIGQYSEECLFRFGEKVLMLSATILNKEAFCESLGIDLNEVEFLSVKSSFDSKNAPTIYIPVGNLSIGNIDKVLPKMAETVEAIIKQHPKEKGIIHTRTFKIAKFLKNNIKSKRLLLHSSDDKEDVLKKYMKSGDSSILLSPSSTEGLDLKDDLSRFQIICKLHWPYLGDELVIKRMEKYKYWYNYQAVKSIIQARGRSIRSENDYAITYILDEDFERLFKKNYKMFPKYFIDSLHID